ncbi:MAG: hypothetical protein A2156_08070 [Deltaproteobacteria bacterium RBG_16_48_10]|nr:MAG: hypothetical protein A2156_08070 [Deltaproteobacteria bacterium RBG_16_48_10]
MSTRKREGIWKPIMVGMFSLVWVIVFSGIGFGAEGEQKPAAKKAEQAPSPAKTKTPAKSFPDGGGDESYSPGIDLVVSKVEITKGIFAGERKIQIIPYIKNMWRGRTSSRIKILLHGNVQGVSGSGGILLSTLDMAGWIEGGIGPNEEKRGGALYRSYDPESLFALQFSIVVDSDNEIPENNDLNNRCGNITFSSSETSKTHRCPIVGPHEPLR